MSQKFKDFCEETGRDWKAYNNLYLFDEYADWRLDSEDSVSAYTPNMPPSDPPMPRLEEKKCYAVVFMNYHPLEVDSLWETRDDAQKHILGLTNPGNWDVCEMEIRK